MNAPAPFNIAVMQTQPRFADVKGNLEEISLNFPRSADLVVLPELCTTGYQFRSREEAMDLAEDLDSGHSVNFFRSLAVQYHAAIAAGIAERAGDSLYNAALLVNPEGQVTVYRKINLFYRENEFFSPGTDIPPLVQLENARVGLMICFDWIFPEVARSLALQGAQIIAHPSNLVLPFCQDAMITRSIENRVFTATANRIGTEDRWPADALNFTGASQITSPAGRRLAKASTDRPETLQTTIHPADADDKQLNAHNHLMQMTLRNKVLHSPAPDAELSAPSAIERRKKV